MSELKGVKTKRPELTDSGRPRDDFRKRYARFAQENDPHIITALTRSTSQAFFAPAINRLPNG